MRRLAGANQGDSSIVQKVGAGLFGAGQKDVAGHTNPETALLMRHVVAAPASTQGVGLERVFLRIGARLFFETMQTVTLIRQHRRHP